MKRIILHRAFQDNAGGFQDAGAELLVGSRVDSRVIDAGRAGELVDGHGAVIVAGSKRRSQAPSTPHEG